MDNEFAADKVIAIGVSAGGPPAMMEFLKSIPEGFSTPIIIVQHMTPGFMHSLRDSLEKVSTLAVKFAEDGLCVSAGSVYLAPDEFHLNIDCNKKFRLIKNTDSGIRHIPSIDLFMVSVASVYGSSAAGVIMTGMGQDGAQGIQAIKASGGLTIAQDEKTSAVYGMNKVAIEAGCIDKVLPLDRIAFELVNWTIK